jgi:hypothetical protein
VFRNSSRSDLETEALLVVVVVAVAVTALEEVLLPLESRSLTTALFVFF